jgi:hypothetical protein
MFGIIFVWGLILAFYNLEVLTGFLFVVEATALLVLILFLLALNFEGRQTSIKLPLLYGWGVLIGAYLFFCYAYTRPYFFKHLNAIAF